MSSPTLFEGLEPRLLLDAAPDLHGTLTVTARDYPGPAPDPADIVYLDYVRNADPAPGLASYTLHLRCDRAGYRANGLAGRFDGPMNQVWAGGIIETPTLTGANLLTAQQRAVDTHLLFEDDVLFVPPGSEPHEDRDAGTGLGSYLANGPAKNMIFILLGDNAAADVALAQLVVPAGQQVTVAGDAAYKWQAGGETQYGENPVALTIPAADGTFSVSYEITNSGDADAGPFAVDFYLSADAEVPGGDTLLSRVELPALAAGATTTGTLSDLAFPAEGSWYVGMVIDADGQVAESIEANNLAVEQISDQNPAISIGDVQVVETDAGTASAVFTLELSAATRRRVAVAYGTADGTASAGSDYTAASGTVTFSPGQVTQTVTIAVLGETDFEPDETFTVELSDPHNAVIADAQGTGTILNDDLPTLSIDDVQAAEGDAGTTELVFTVSLAAAREEPVTVDYATADGSAIAGADYTPAAGTLTFQPGTTSQTLAVTILGDTVFEPDEVFYVNLSNVANAGIADAQGAGTIVNDDPPTVSIADAQMTEGDAGSTDLLFAVTLAGPADQVVTVDYVASPGTASEGDDYGPVAGTLTFQPGTTTQTVAVAVAGDTAIELDETLAVTLSNAAGATIADGQATGTILNDDWPAVSIQDVQVIESTGGTVDAVFTVSLSAPGLEAVTVDYATADGSAKADTDYTAISGKVTFAPGQTVRTVTVEVIADATAEADETFFVDLANPVNAVLADAHGQATIVDDDGRVIDFGGKVKARFIDADGDQVTVMLKGSGAGQVALPAAGNADAAEIRLTGTTAKSQLVVKVKAGRTRVGAITADAALGVINAKTTDLAGDLTVAGSLGKLLLGNVDADHHITIGPRAVGDTKTATTIVLGAVADTSLITATPIKALTLARWRDNDGVADVLQAPWLGKLTTKAGRAGPGHFAADLVLDGTASPPKAVLGTVKIAGDLLDVSWSIAGSTGKLTVTGSAVGCVVRSAGDMGPVSLGRSAGSDFLAGIDPDAGRHATAGGDFAVAATIKSFKVKGLKGPEAGRYFFSNSNVSAASIGAVVLLNIEFANGGEAFGLWARNAGTAREIKSVKWADKVTGTKGRWSPKDGQVFAQPDMVIQIIP